MTLLDENVPVLVLTREMFAQEWKPPEQDENEDVINKQTVDTPVPFLPGVIVLADQVLESEIDIPVCPCRIYITPVTR